MPLLQPTLQQCCQVSCACSFRERGRLCLTAHLGTQEACAVLRRVVLHGVARLPAVLCARPQLGHLHTASAQSAGQGMCLRQSEHDSAGSRAASRIKLSNR